MLNELQTSRLWDHVALTDDETPVLKALNLTMGDEVVGIAMVGEGRRGARRAIVRLKSQHRPVPLRVLGMVPFDCLVLHWHWQIAAPDFYLSTKPRTASTIPFSAISGP